MVDPLAVGDHAPEFAAPLATPDRARDGRGEYTADDVTRVTLAETLSDGPAAFAFFPGAFSRTCTREVCAVRDWVAEVGDLDAGVYGVSADTPFSQLAFIDAYDLSYPLVSGFNTSLLADWGVRRDGGLLAGLARRTVYVVAPDRTVTYRWWTDEPLDLPDLDAVAAALDEA